MGIKTGNPRGRPAGSRNKRTEAVVAAAEAAAAQIAEAVPGAFEGDAHALLMTVYKDPAHDMHLRIDAAKAAIRYEKPALATVDVGNKDDEAFKIAKRIELVGVRPGDGSTQDT